MAAKLPGLLYGSRIFHSVMRASNISLKAFEPYIGLSCKSSNGVMQARGNVCQLGDLLRSARAARQLSQLELALRIGMSQRHLAFVELGRSLPSRAMLGMLLEELAPPPSVRNAILHAADFPSDAVRVDEDGAEFPAAVRSMLNAHEPYPALVFDSEWICRSMNGGAAQLARLVMPNSGVLSGATRTFDMIEAMADPAGLLSLVRDPELVAASLLTQLWTEAWVHPALLHRVRNCDETLTKRYGQLPKCPRDPATPHLDLCFDTSKGVLCFETFQFVPSLPQNTHVASIRVELWYPSDDSTLRAMLDLRTNTGSDDIL